MFNRTSLYIFDWVIFNQNLHQDLFDSSSEDISDVHEGVRWQDKMISVGLGKEMAGDILGRFWIKLLVLIDLVKDSISWINNDEKEKDIQKNFFRKYVMMILKWILFLWIFMTILKLLITIWIFSV